jgi:glutamate 5-kinase
LEEEKRKGNKSKMNRSSFTDTIQSAKTIVIKVGSARVSGSNFEVNDFLFSLADDVRELRDMGKRIILVSSGAVAQGRKVLSLYKGNANGMSTPERQALAALGQSQLMHLYESIFSKVNVPIAQILFGTPDIEVSSGYENLQNTFNQLLDWQVLPIVNENDSIAVEELKLGDNDILSSLVTLLVKADLLVILTGVEGFIKNGKKVDFLSEITNEDKNEAKGPEGPGTGGMNTKLKAAEFLLKAGVPTAIISGKKRNCILEFFRDNQSGTLIANTTPRKVLSEREIKTLFELD